MVTIQLAPYRQRLKKANLFKYIGKVTRVTGLIIEVMGLHASIGDLCSIEVEGNGSPLLSEVVGFRDNSSILMSLGELSGISPGCRVAPIGSSFQVNVGEGLLGRVLGSLGEVLDGERPKLSGTSYPIQNSPPNPLCRKPITDILETGIKSIDALLTCGIGQRIGIFSGSGVGKSTLLGMIARNSSADVNVIALIGERGREVLEFIKKDLGEDGLKRSVLVVSTSDQPALLRVKGALVATSIAEYFKDQGKNVLLMMDSVTRFAMAQREIGLAVGEPPTTKGYPPSVFALLPKLLERAGNMDKGSITGLYTVLVDADDMNEPIADAVRGILDGHIVLSRELTFQNHFPAIDVLQSISRLMPYIVDPEQLALSTKLKNHLAIYKKNQDLINIGAYQAGSNMEIDSAIEFYPPIEGFLKQDIGESYTLKETLALLATAVRGGMGN